MKTIENIELLKKLHPYMKGETGYNTLHEWLEYRTLTLEEAIELLPDFIKDKDLRDGYVSIWKMDWEYDIKYSYWVWEDEETIVEFIWKTLLEAIEKMLEYLINNNLLWNK